MVNICTCMVHVWLTYTMKLKQKMMVANQRFLGKATFRILLDVLNFENSRKRICWNNFLTTEKPVM